MEAWLRGLRLEQYSVKLCAGGFLTLEDCSTITEPDLINLDILPGHRKRILMNIPVQRAAPVPDEDDDDAVYANVPTLTRHRGSSDYIPPSRLSGSNNGHVDFGGSLQGAVSYQDNDVYDVPPPQPTSDDVYDVPVPRPRMGSSTSATKVGEESDDEDYYVNVTELNLSKKSQDHSPPPLLPPKKSSITKRESMNDMFGITPPTESGKKKPVAAPRKNVTGKSPGSPNLLNMPLGVSLDTALDEELSPGKGTPRPVPKPRMKRNNSGNSSLTTSIGDTAGFSSLPTVPSKGDEVIPTGPTTPKDTTPSMAKDQFVKDKTAQKSKSIPELVDSVYDEPASPEQERDMMYDKPIVPVQKVMASPVRKVLSPDEGIASGNETWEDDLYEPVGELPSRTESGILPPAEVKTTKLPQPVIESEPGYGSVWVSSSRVSYGGELMPVMQPTVVKPDPPKQEVKDPVPPARKTKETSVEKKSKISNLPPQTTEEVPGIFSLDSIVWEQFSPDTRESVAFCEPPPNFTPPPLPPGVPPPSFFPKSAPKPTTGPPLMKPLARTVSDTSSSTKVTGPTTPPIIPPRPKNQPAKPESPKSEDKPRPRSSSNSSFTAIGLRTQVPAIPEEGPPADNAPVLYDTPADATGAMVDNQDAQYSQVPDRYMSSPNRTSSFTDLTNTAQQSPTGGFSPSKGACAHPEPPPPEKSRHPVAPERSTSQSLEENIYTDGPVRVASTPMPPVPPPRTKAASLLFEPVFADLNSNLENSSKNLADLESDDTLSDGGEFLESELRHLRPSVLQTSIPIVPATPNAIKQRKGYLYKLPSNCYNSRRSQKRMGWRKRWVVFDGEELMYFSDEKSVISKRIIPLNTMVNVEQQIKGGSSVLKRVSEMGDMHPYEFKLTTIDRIYRFAADDGDDLTMWTSILMRAIIDSKPERFEEGGSMSRPEREGFVRMEGLKGRQYLVIKKDMFCYYNTFSDYKVGTPIHRVHLQLASVKDSGKGKLLLMTPYVSFGLLCESEAELSLWKEAFEEGIAEGLGDDTILKEVFENQNNRLCADCGAPDPHWASINLGITLCKQCAGVHRMLSAPQSKVRSLRMDFRVWTPTLIQMLQRIGNENSNNYWEWNSTEDDRIDSDADMSSRQEYILSKYRDRKFFRFHPLRSDSQALNEALCKSVQYGDVLETLQALYTGADMMYTSSSYGAQRETSLQLARKAKQTLQTEFLYQNGAEGYGGQATNGDPLLGVVSQVSIHEPTVVMKGYLYKMQNNLREYNRRWFVLERGVLSYFENDKSTVAKDSLERKEIMSVGATSDDKYEFGLEVGTTKAGGRVFILAADTEEERNQWMVKLAKSFAPLPTESIDKIKDLDRGGLIFLREGATTDWQMTWMHMKRKTLYIYKKDEQQFEEIDIRKVTGTRKFTHCSTQTLQRTDLCLETFDDGPPFVIDLPNRAFYIQGDTRAETESWFQLVRRVSTESSGYLVDMQLTADNVPVIVDKCVNFVSAHGMRMEGLYRLNGQHSKVGTLLEEFQTNAQNVFLSLDLYQVHDVATALKRLFRTLDEPLLTSALFSKWIETTNMTENGPKMQWYKYLLGELPTVHYATLKRLMIHTARVASFEVENKMSEVNLASIFGPILMKVDKESAGQAGYGSTNQEIGVVLDLIANHKWLFEIKDDELEHERKIQEAVDKIERASRENQKMRESLVNISSQAGDLLIGIYVHSRDGDVITLKVPATMTTQEVLQFVESKADLDSNVHWGIYEVVCQNQLERPLHYLERVLDVNLRWSRWAEEFSRDNYLVVKPNIVIDKVKQVFDPHFSLFNEFKFSEKKGFKKFYFEFSKYKLSYQKDTRAANPISSWNIEELILYNGIEQKRGPPTRWGLTFVSSTDKIVKTKDTPFFGHSISCISEEEMYRWLAAMLHAQHPGGLVPEGMLLPVAPSNDPPLPIAVDPSDNAARPESSRSKKFFQKFGRR